MGIIDKVMAGTNSVGNSSNTGVSADDFRIKLITNLGTGNVLDRLINWVGIIAGIVAFFYLVYGGFIYITAAGNPESAKKGGQAIVNAIIGLVVIALAYGILQWIKTSFGI